MFRGLSRNADIRRVFRHGRRYPVSFGRVFIVEKENGPTTVTVLAKGKLGNAVRRNRARRLIKEAIRKTAPERPFDIIVRLNTLEFDYQQAFKECRRVTEEYGKAGSKTD